MNVDLPERPDDPSQAHVRSWFLALGSDPWLPLYSGVGEDGWNFGTSSAIAPPDYREEALSQPSWDLLHGAHAPGFVQGTNDLGEWVTTYLRTSSDPLEPLVIERDFHGVRPPYRELAEEFRLYHNLFKEADRDRFLKFDDAGNDALAAEIQPNQVSVRTSLVRQYQAARQVDLLLFIESTVFYDTFLPTPPNETWVTTDMNGELYTGVIDGRPFSRFLATRVLPPPPIEHAGIWPFEDADEHFPDFIIGTDASGRPTRHSCDPETLSNYFGANPGEPHYLTPVHFRREVLGKYLARPDLYRIKDGSLRCAGLWSLRLDNDAEDTVIVWLGDLGRDLPVPERDYWLSYNVPPVGGLSETAFRRDILGQWADPTSVDLRFRAAYEVLRTEWRRRFGWSLFRDPEPGDQHLLDGIRRPLHDTEAEFESLVRILTILLVDSLDEGSIAKELLAGPKDEKGISKLERWLRQSGYPEVDRDIAYLRTLQAVRSKGTAHRKGSDYEKELTRALGPRRKADAANYLLEGGLDTVMSLRAFADSGPRTTAPMGVVARDDPGPAIAPPTAE